ncbi:hypothetical protein KKG52_01870, partial [Patescibacteria group bacterium]|nr:hypothetical protein [Patescibacteria group bacterium]
MGKTREEKSQWQEEQKKQERNSLYKKVGIWSAVVLVTIASLWGLILLTEPSTNTGSGTNNIAPVSKNDIKIGTDS